MLVSARRNALFCRFDRKAFVGLFRQAMISYSSTSETQSDGPNQPSDSNGSGCAVHIQFSPSQGPRLERREPTTCGDGRALWAERPLLMRRVDGTYELVGISENLSGLARWILSYGADAEVQGPSRLRQWVASEARRVLDMYREE